MTVPEPDEVRASLRAHAAGTPHLAILDDSVLTPDLLAEYTMDPDALVRQGVAVHPHTTPETLIYLIRGEDDSDVREAAWKSCPEHIRAIMALGWEYDPQEVALRTALRSGALIFCWGPGSGKGELIQSVAEGVHAHLETVMPGTLDPASITGTQYVVDGEATSVVPQWADRLLQAGRAGKKTMVFFNVDATTPEQQDAVAQVMERRAVGGQPLPAGIMMVAAGDFRAVWKRPVVPSGRIMQVQVQEFHIS